MLDRKTGVWLSHSTPKFPTYHNKDFWPSNGNENAQTFICVTYAYDQFKEIGRLITHCSASFFFFVVVVVCCLSGKYQHILKLHL